MAVVQSRPVALIVPIPKPEDEIGRLVAEGLAEPGVGNLSDLPAPLLPPKGCSLLPSEVLAELRADER